MNGTRPGPYEILSPLGAGGMGEPEPFCGLEHGESPPAKSRVLTLRSEQAPRGISC